MDDTQAARCLEALLNLAVTIRDEGPDAVAKAAREALLAAGGDPLAALTAAAALIRIDEPVDAWWQNSDGRPTSTPLAPCGTRSALDRHRQRGELIDDACREAERRHDRARAHRRATKPPRELSPCGTHAAYERHRRRGEPIDQNCRTAETAYKSALAKARKAAA